MEKEQSSITINISGGNNQILPNATEAIQNFNYQTTEEDKDPTRVRLYNNVYVDSNYIIKLKECFSAADFASVIIEMIEDEDIPYLDTTLAVKSSFFNQLLPYCPNFRSGNSDSNIRSYINKGLATKTNRPYGSQQ